MDGRYLMSFTAGGLLLQESVKAAQFYMECKDWEMVHTAAVNDNLLQLRTVSSMRRIFAEVHSRLLTLSEQELAILVDRDMTERKNFLWLAICRRYQFIYDFAVEVVKEHFLTRRLMLNQVDFNSFFNSKAQFHDELDALAKSTQIKLRQVLFRMLQEAGLVDKQGMIIAVAPSRRVMAAIAAHNAADVAVFPFNLTASFGEA